MSALFAVNLAIVAVAARARAQTTLLKRVCELAIATQAAVAIAQAAGLNARAMVLVLCPVVACAALAGAAYAVRSSRAP